MRKLPLSLALALPCIAFSQSNAIGAWNATSIKLNLSSKWSVFNELQLRSQSFYKDFYYYEIKFGVAYSVNKNFSFLMGTGKYITYSDGGNFKGPLTGDESRLWEQVTMNQYFQRIKLEHRYRIEQRWLKTGYRNRFRYRLATAIPLNKKTFGPGTIYMTAYDELFLTNKSPYFERNRLFGGAGYQFSRQFTVQPGWLYQVDYRNNASFRKHYFQLSLMVELNVHHVPHQHMPINGD
ncbi:MAG: DUF2490 domain-containing protein [Bacteroidetes bacterium]|nr:MAG: DUF2490 domain-containing protein [Bacteroidota bacterium]